ncbi:MAG: hypothetical protein JXA04_02860 [Gammaproteobacteria bacterium]|nr:hypothetical protein [Gammaproteobacteria bacterium]
MIIQQQRFRVVFVGEIDPKKDLEQVKAKLGQRFKLPPSILGRLFLGRPIVVKNNVDAETAYRYKTEIDLLGGVSRIEPIPIRKDYDEKGFIERRRGDRRLRPERRKVARSGSIQPDRRKKDRRQSNGSGKVVTES